MQFAHSAAARLRVALEARPRDEREWGWVVDLLLAVTDFGPAPRHIVITRIDTGEVLVRSPAPQHVEWTVDQMQCELRKLDEAAWLSRWGDPSTWTTYK